jgi:hypothetical protein
MRHSGGFIQDKNESYNDGGSHLQLGSSASKSVKVSVVDIGSNLRKGSVSSKRSSKSNSSDDRM